MLCSCTGESDKKKTAGTLKFKSENQLPQLLIQNSDRNSARIDISISNPAFLHMKQTRVMERPSPSLELEIIICSYSYLSSPLTLQPDGQSTCNPNY
jgi:hypothetical protein